MYPMIRSRLIAILLTAISASAATANEIYLPVAVSISPDGFISQVGTIYALGMSQPESTDELVKVGHNMFQPIGKVNPLELGERNVRQGYLEMSGANPTRQMMAMIETTRAFEANTRMIQNQDTMLGALISRVLQA